MGTNSAKAVLLLMLMALPCIAFPQGTPSDAAFRAFISVSVNGSTVWAKVTHLNITYFSQINGSALAEIYRKANASRNLGDLYGVGDFSSENFTASVDPVANASLRFTFEGMNVTDGNGNENCNPVKTDGNGTASCDILYFRDANGQERSIADYRSCGYVVVRLDGMGLPGGRLQSASQAAVVCPEDNLALSAFGPAIQSEVGTRLPFCFPAMLIAGLLIAAMYYSGRDPLSLFDITTPKLPKTQTFKVKMETSPQMLRQVQRRYLMIKGQARRDAIREVARMARAAGRSKSEIADAKRRMGRFYDDVESRLKRGLKGNEELEIRQKWAKMMEEYSGGGGKRVDRSLAFSSGLLEAYIKAHQSRQSMQAARNRTSKGGWTKRISDKVVNSLTDASIAFETSKTGRVLGRVPILKKVVSTPTKVLDVAAQWRGSRNALKGIRGELIGQAAYMLGQTKAGRPLYRAAKALHMGRGGKETGIARAYRKMTGRTFKAFEEKHNLAEKRLVEYYKVADSAGQQAIDAHNAMFDELARRLIESMPLRANAARQFAEKLSKKGMGKEAAESLMRANSLDELFNRMRTGLEKTDRGRGIAMRISALLEKDAGRVRKDEIEGLRTQLKGVRLTEEQRNNLKILLNTVSESVAKENDLNSLLKGLNRTARTQGEILERMATLAGDKGKSVQGALKQFGDAETALLENMLVFLDKDIRSRSLNYYRAVDRDQLKSDIAGGMNIEKLGKKYGEGLVGRIFDEKGAPIRLFGDAVTDKAVEGRVFAKFAAEEEKMKGWILGGMIIDKVANKTLLDHYKAIANGLKDCAFGRNPLELKIADELLRLLTGKTVGMREEDARLIVYTDGKSAPRFTGMDSLEQFFKGKANGAAYGSVDDLEKLGIPRNAAQAFLDARGRGKDPESMLKAIMPGVLDFAREWSARQYATADIMHNGGNAGRYMASFRAALKDIENFGKVKNNLGYLGGEKAFYRWEMGYNDYRGVDTEALVFTARGWEKLFGFVVADRWAGTSRGEQVLHRLDSASKDYAATIERYKALYLNLIDERSVFYDAKFAAGKGKVEEKDIGNFRLNAMMYDALLARGYTWQDKKNGLELLLSVDRKSVPMLEHDSKYMREGQGMIVKKAEFNGGKADIRDYAPLLARTMGSDYSTREAGFIVLTRQEIKDKDGNVVGSKWIYGDPFKAEKGKGGERLSAYELHQKASMQITMRKDIMETLAGLKAGGKYDPGNSPIRVISVKDFVSYAKDPAYSGKENVFGETGRLDRMRESLRSGSIYRPGMLAAELLYGAYGERMDRMNKWYAGQWQLRQALDRLQHTLQDGGGMLEGSTRFKYDGNYIGSYNDAGKAEKWKAHRDMDEETRKELEAEMKRLARGQSDSWLDNARAWGTEWRSRIASGIVGELGRAETDFHNAKLEVRALERLAAKDPAAYSGLCSEALERKERMLDDYKDAKKEYMGFNRDVIGWTGSGGVYTPQRTMWNLGLAGRLLDSRFVQGTKDAFYQITESSVMRDPRVAIGASTPGWEHSYYVGYHTGQNVYERSRFWATNSLWEQQIRLKTDFAYTVHKWWNDRISFFSRYTSGYPAPVQSDMMYAPHHQDKSWGSYIKTLLVTVPFQPRAYTDYFRARWQDAISFTGAGAAAAAYQSLGGAGPGDEGRSWLRNQLDRRGRESPHYFSTPFRIASQQRYVDQVMAFDDFVDKHGREMKVDVDGENMSLNEARDRLKHAAAAMDYETENAYKKKISDTIGKYVRLDDRRGRFVRDVFSGSDIQEDGSRNRFLDMYSVFHSNVFSPTIPGMLHSAPLGNSEWHTYPQVARNVENSGPGTVLHPTKHYWEASYDKDEGRITFADRFSTREDAVAEAYRNDVPVLMHLMKMQQKDIHYSPINTPSLSFASPIVFGLGRKLYRTAVTCMPGLESLQSTVEPHHAKEWEDMAANIATLGMYGMYGDYRKKKKLARPAEEDAYETRRVIYGRASQLAHEGDISGEHLSEVNAASRRLTRWLENAGMETMPGRKKIKVKDRYIGAMLKRSG